jgi:hypothetical protein
LGSLISGHCISCAGALASVGPALYEDGKWL